MTIEEMKKRREELGLTYEELADRSGVPVGTVQKIFSGATKSPRYKTLQALENVLSPDRSRGFSYDETSVREDSAAYVTGRQKRQGEYTLEDYYAIPDDRRVELIDGVIYDMTAPAPVHQLIAGQLHAKLLSSITEQGADCIPFIAPTDVQLDRDNRTMVEPDVFIVCDRSKITDKNIYGEPEFVAEVLSKSTRKKDMSVKLNKYSHAGVIEYWVIDPVKKKIIVYLFGREPDVNIYGFTDTIPVAVSGGACEINFGEIYDYVKFLYNQEEDSGGN